MADLISQKIIVNLETPMSIGRIAAQAAHASWIAVLNESKWTSDTLTIDTKNNPVLSHWLKDQFTKVMLRGWGDQMLIDICDKALKAGLPCGLMREDGYVTALAVGPAYTTDIDRVIGRLQLL